MCARAYVKNTETYAFPTCDHAGGATTSRTNKVRQPHALIKCDNLTHKKVRQLTNSILAAQAERQPHALIKCDNLTH